LQFRFTSREHFHAREKGSYLKIESFLVLDRDIFGFRQGILKFLSSPGWPRVADEFERAENESDADSLSAGSSAKACCLTHRRHVRRRLPGWRCETCVHRSLGLSPLRPAEASSRRYPFATGQIPDHRSQQAKHGLRSRGRAESHGLIFCLVIQRFHHQNGIMKTYQFNRI
jgi:hypothetical protein